MSKALWIPAWVVTQAGDAVREVKASVSEYTVMVRELGATKGGRQYGPAFFERYFAPTREGAIDRFVAHHTEQIEIAEQHIEEARDLIRRAEALK